MDSDSWKMSSVVIVTSNVLFCSADKFEAARLSSLFGFAIVDYVGRGCVGWWLQLVQV